MVVRLGVVVIFVALLAGLDANHNWDLAVAVGNQIELLDRNGSLVGITVQQFKNVKGLAFDDLRHQFIISDTFDEYDSIYQLQLTDNKKEAVPLIANIPDDIKFVSIDPITDTIYWIDALQKQILMLRLNDVNAKSKVLFKFEEQIPFGIAVDSCRRKIYWTNSNLPESTIERSNLDGTHREVILSSNIFLPSGITIDQGSERIYWADRGEGIYFRIESATLNGTDRKIVYQDIHQNPFDISVSKDTVYWTDINNQALWGLKKDEVGLQPTLLKKFSEKPMGLVAVNNDYKNVPQCSEITNALKKYNGSSEEKFEKATDSIECLNFGQLTPHGCKCNRGFAGPRCEVALCHNYCLNGDCRHSSEGYAQCKCRPGYIGTRCEYEVCKGFCLNGGKCTPSINNTTWPATCECGTHYSGKRCERINDAETWCSELCDDGYLYIFMENGKPTCRCNREITSDNIIEAGKLSMNLETEMKERMKDPIFIVSWLITIIMLFTIIGLSVVICKVRRRPRIKKRIIVNKNITPLTCRPNQPTEQCEITIENCCNMNICETPCFEPPNLLGYQRTKPEEKKTLLTSMENGEDIY